MSDELRITAILAYGYLLGSVPMAYVTGRLVKGVDLRKVGSGTVGASNVWYNVGKFWIFPVGIFDLFVKGLTPVFIARGLDLGVEVQAGAGILAVVGHNWPLYLKFQGGRGVAPTVGVLIAMARLELAAFIVIGTVGWQLTRGSAVWVLIGFASLPALAWYWDRPVAVVLLMLGLLLITITKRLASNSLRGVGTRVLLNRLVFDRDIADHDAWMHRTAQAPPSQEAPTRGA